jgi:3-oxoacyl-[acyl-carrier-protein] synthase II
VHGIKASSRTFMGEEMAGLAAVENCWRRIAAGQADLVLVGGALNAEREDLLLGFELGQNLWQGPYAPVWGRRDAGGGMILGSVGAFLVLEARSHAEARQVRPYARIVDVATNRDGRCAGELTQSLIGLFEGMRSHELQGPLPILSGASGVEPATSGETAFLDYLPARAIEPVIRAYGSELGHGVEAHVPAGLALASLAIRYGCLPAPREPNSMERPFAGAVDRVLLTGVGHWLGEGMALVETAN